MQWELRGVKTSWGVGLEESCGLYRYLCDLRAIGRRKRNGVYSEAEKDADGCRGAGLAIALYEPHDVSMSAKENLKREVK